MSGAFTHPYLPTSPEQIKKKMMEKIGIKSIDELYSEIPNEVKLKRKLKIPGPMSEYEIMLHINEILSENKSFYDIPIFLGAGCWPHYVPVAVQEIINRAEFATSYTPYQPEISQGMLQSLFEYQSMVCELTGMDFANSSMYDWASALGEAARMASRVTGRDEFLVPSYMHPERLKTLETFTEPVGIKVIKIRQDSRSGQTDLSDLMKKISKKTAGVYIENPSYLGFLEMQVDELSDISHKNDSLFIVGVDPISLGILKAPGDYGADIVIGEGQPLGNFMNYGGPLLGIFACRGERLLRQMPGRIIGMTTTIDGNQIAYCMVLQTREQHIRREKATSNICSNEALCAVAGAVYLSLLGPKGLRELCNSILVKSHYAMKRLEEVEGVRVPLFDAPHFKEFVVNFDKTGKDVKAIHEALIQKGIQGGKMLKEEFPELGESSLYCFTEIHRKEDIDALVEKLKEVSSR
ncbi:MAG: aminomethyl-transferring glycine dehydrogenase subunit GcvPA [Candidatus Bathyarchaeia archaeon]